MSIEPSNEAFEIAAEGEHVVIDGAGGVAVTLTPQAAADTSDRLLSSAIEAAGRAKMRDHRERSLNLP